MILSGHQPVYIPGIILFNKIALSDQFMFVGHCQLVQGSWQTRNQIRTGMLSVPVLHKFGQSINEAKMVSNNWKRKHLRSIELAYKKRPFFDLYYPFIVKMMDENWYSLGTMNISLIILMLEWFKLETQITISEMHKIEGHKTDMLISMCKAIGADEYLSNEARGITSMKRKWRMPE